MSVRKSSYLRPRNHTYRSARRILSTSSRRSARSRRERPRSGRVPASGVQNQNRRAPQDLFMAHQNLLHHAHCNVSRYPVSISQSSSWSCLRKALSSGLNFISVSWIHRRKSRRPIAVQNSPHPPLGCLRDKRYSRILAERRHRQHQRGAVLPLRGAHRPSQAVRHRQPLPSMGQASDLAKEKIFFETLVTEYQIGSLEW